MTASQKLEKLTPGSRIGRIRVERLLGEGGMGSVYQGFDEILGRPVALKVAGRKAELEPIDTTRFLREARALSRLDHPSICRIYDLIERPDADVLVLELIEGQTLRQALVGGLSAVERLRIALTLAQVLAAAHGEQVIHRDLKPDNVMLTSDGTVKVLDFGLSRLIDEPDLPWPAGEGGAPGKPSGEVENGEAHASSDRTSHGSTVGTIRYMSPEQARSEVVTAATDIYSLGVILFEMFVGRSPYPRGLSRMQLALKVAEGRTEAVPRAGSEVDAELAGLIQDLLQLEPDRRPTAEQAAARLGNLVDRPFRRARRIRFALAAVTVAFALAGAVVVTNRLASPQLRAPSEPASVVVLPFANDTGEADQGWVEWGLQELVAEGLRGEDSTLTVLPSADVRRAVDVAGIQGAEPLTAAQAELVSTATGARFIVRTTVLESGGEHVLRSVIHDPFGPRTTKEVAAAEPTAAARILTRELARLLSSPIPDDLRVPRWSEHELVNQLYAIGVQRMITTGPASAKSFFDVCLTLDPGFAPATVKLATAAFMTGDLGGSRELSESLLEHDDPLIRVESLRCLALVESREGNWPQARDALDQALRLATEHGSASDRADVMSTLANQLVREGDLDRAEAAMLEAREILRREGNLLNATYITQNLGVLAHERGDNETALERYEEAARIAVDLHDRGLTTSCELNLGVLAWDREDFDAARRHYLAALEIAREQGIKEEEALLCNNLAGVAMIQEDDRATREYFQRAFDLYGEIGNVPGLALTARNLGEYLVVGEEYEAAAPHVARALEWYDDAGTWILNAYLQAGLGRCDQALEALDRARELDPSSWTDDEGELAATCRASSAGGV